MSATAAATRRKLLPAHDKNNLAFVNAMNVQTEYGIPSATTKAWLVSDFLDQPDQIGF